MKEGLLRGVKSLASRFLVALVILQNLAIAIPAANAAEQSSYRWRNDDGTEATATWAAAENTPANVLRGTPERLRFGANHETVDGDVTTSVRLNAGDDGYFPSALDGTDLYVASAESPARLLKFDTTSGPPYSAPGEIDLATGENNVYTLALDTANDRGYFVTSTVPSKVIKVQLSTFTRLSTLTLSSGDNYVAGSVIYNGYLYLVARTNPGKLLKVNLTSFTEVTSDTLSLGDDLTYATANPIANDNKLYYADGNNYVFKIDVTSPGSSAPSIDTTLTIPTPSSPYNNAVYTYVYGGIIDTSNDYLYVSNYYGLIHKIDISGGTTFSYVGYTPTISALDGAFAIDQASGKLYVGSYNAYISKIDLGTFTQDAANTSLNYGNIYSLTVSGDGSTVYAPSWDAPAHIQAIATSTLTPTTVYDGASRGDDGANSAVIDTATNYMYIGTSYNDRVNGDEIIQVDRNTMTRTGRIVLPDGYESLGAAAIDVTDRYAYFIDYNAPSHLIRVHLDAFPTYDVLTLPADGPYYYHYDAMAIDPNPAHHYLYLGSYGVPSVVTQVDLNTFTRGSTLQLLSSPMEDRLYNSLAIDTVNNKLYAGVGSSSGRVVRIDITGSNLTRNGAISTPSDAFASAALVDEAAGILYLGSNSSDILKINVANGTTFSIMGNVYVGGFEDYVFNFSLDTVNGMLYAGGAGTPGKVFRIQTPTFSYDTGDDIIAPNGEEYVYTVNVDSNDGSVYYTSYQAPSLVTKVTANPRKRFRLEYAPKSGTCAASTYTAVANGNDWEPALSSNVTNGSATTNVVGGLTDPATYFKAGYVMTAGGQTPALQVVNDHFSELEYSIKAKSTAAPGDYCFRLTDAGSALATYTNYAEATLKTNDVTVSNNATLGSMKVNATTSMTVGFTLQNTLDGTLTVTLPTAPGEFTINSDPQPFPYSSACLSGFGHTSSTVFATKTACSGAIYLGGFSVTNPSSPGAYTISWVNDDPGYTIVAIVDSDQVNVNAQVSPSITFDLNANTNNAPQAAPYSVALGTLTTGTVKHSNNSGVNSIWANLDTNASGGAIVTVLSQNAALASQSVPSDTIPNSAASMAAGVANYGLCVNTITVPSATGGTFQAAAPYNLGTCDPAGSTNAVKTLSMITPTSILNTNSSGASGGVAEILVNAAISNSTIAHSDYEDVLTFIATGTF